MYCLACPAVSRTSLPNEICIIGSIRKMKQKVEKKNPWAGKTAFEEQKNY